MLYGDYIRAIFFGADSSALRLGPSKSNRRSGYTKSLTSVGDLHANRDLTLLASIFVHVCLGEDKEIRSPIRGQPAARSRVQRLGLMTLNPKPIRLKRTLWNPS